MPHREAFRKEGPTLFPNLGQWRKENFTTAADVQRILKSVHEQLSYIKGAPSVQMQTIPPDLQGWREELEEAYQERRREKEEIKEERNGAGGLLRVGRRRELERIGSSTKGDFMNF